ncbi:MAG: autotransporter adhesin family protein [Treponema sp.]|nr:autotransporter adhesin family protein [Treponema sp.]
MKKNISMYLRILLIVLSVCTVCACFSPWTGDDCTLAINLTGQTANNARLINPDDIPGYLHTVTLTGSGVSIQQKFSGTSAVLKAAPGKYFLTVKAYRTYDDGGPQVGELQAWGGQEITLKPGLNTPVDMVMASASEVTSYLDLASLLLYISDNPGSSEIIIIKNDIPTPDEAAYLATYLADNLLYISGFNVTLMAESNVAINFPALQMSGSSVGLINVSNSGSLTLGMDGMSGTITIDGGKNSSQTSGNNSNPLIYIGGGGAVVMNDRVNLRNNYNSAVIVYAPGGTPDPQSQGTFIMNGGTISGNDAQNPGGGVCNYGNFTMNAGAISGNTTSYVYGGGVYNSGIFTMNGGTISGNTVTNDSGAGGGVYNGGGYGAIVLNGGEITNNDAMNGGGIYSETPIKTGNTTVRGNMGADIIAPWNITLIPSVEESGSPGSPGGIQLYGNQYLSNRPVFFGVSPNQDQGYVTNTVRVYYKNNFGDIIDINTQFDDGAQQYSFMMPEADVTIEVDFELEP